MGFADHIAAVDLAAQTHLGGEPVVYQPEVGDPVPVTGIFDEEYVHVERGEVGVETVSPAVWLRLEELPVHPDDDDPRITIKGKVYRPRGRVTDGYGGSIRILLVLVNGGAG